MVVVILPNNVVQIPSLNCLAFHQVAQLLLRLHLQHSVHAYVTGLLLVVKLTAIVALAESVMSTMAGLSVEINMMLLNEIALTVL